MLVTLNMTDSLVHNNFREANALFPLFDGLSVPNLDEAVQDTAVNGDATVQQNESQTA